MLATGRWKKHTTSRPERWSRVDDLLIEDANGCRSELRWAEEYCRREYFSIVHVEDKVVADDVTLDGENRYILKLVNLRARQLFLVQASFGAWQNAQVQHLLVL